MGQTERLLAALSVLLLFVYVVLRAIYVPTFHDEAATFFHYLVPGKFLPYSAHWDANNHILNSALAYLSYKTFGTELIWIRLPNVLAFLIYGFYSFRLCSGLKNQLIRALTFLALLTAAFPLEFFSQARGYGMSLAFLLGAVYHGYLYFTSGQPKQQLPLWFWAFLAVSANLALTNTILILVGLVFLRAISGNDKRGWNLAAWMLGVVMLIAASYYGFELKQRGLLYTGFPDGFVKVTVHSLIRHQFGVESMALAWGVALLGLSAGVLLIARFMFAGFHWTFGRLAAALLLLNALGAILLNAIFGMNFPEDRVGVYFFPLFLITFGAALDELQQNRTQVQLLSLAFLVFPVHLLSVVNLNTTLLWPPWHVAEATYSAALQIQEKESRELTVSADYLNELGWSFWNFRNQAAMHQMQRLPVPDTMADLLVGRPTDFSFDSVPYDVVYEDVPNNVFLLKRKEFVNWKRSATPLPMRMEVNGSDEFYEFYNDSTSVLESRSALFELRGRLNTNPTLFRGHLVITGQNAQKELEVYDYIPLYWIRPEWNSSVLNIKRTIHFDDDVIRFKVFLWNIHKQQVELEVEDIGFSFPTHVATIEE